MCYFHWCADAASDRAPYPAAPKNFLVVSPNGGCSLYGGKYRLFLWFMTETGVSVKTESDNGFSCKSKPISLFVRLPTRLILSG